MSDDSHEAYLLLSSILEVSALADGQDSTKGSPETNVRLEAGTLFSVCDRDICGRIKPVISGCCGRIKKKPVISG